MAQQEKNKITISLDQSTTACGYAVWNGTLLIGHGTYKPDALSTADGRISEISTWFRNLIEYSKTKGTITKIYFEDIQLQESINGSKKYFGNGQGNVVTFKVLAQLQGVLINICNILNIDYALVKPSAWKSACGIKAKYRKDQKIETIEYVNTTYNINSKEDEADAICIGRSQLLS